ncbi:MAG: class I SAM-dependent methyltransferase [Acidobacteria bacterium]|nr:MAG: class I SAM-dependent methyltransferase [Acidobacteriota bacterium]REK10705.1 MAG: class I SAM-dependent methyltransferase [Acidobacteriota bacterium]
MREEIERLLAQSRWRDWDRMLDRLPPVAGRRVLDLGCGPGEVTARLARRGARVVGVDADLGLLAFAARRGLDRVGYVAADLRQLGLRPRRVDGIWASFVAAYLPDLAPSLERWRRWLRPGGWIALVEIDDLFAHAPLGSRSRQLLASFADEALAAGRYDFRMGRRLDAEISRAGYRPEHGEWLDDPELSFSGPAAAEVVAAWAQRLDRMVHLQRHCGDEFGALRREFLACLSSERHRGAARVRFCLARNLGEPTPDGGAK